MPVLIPVSKKEYTLEIKFSTMAHEKPDCPESAVVVVPFTTPEELLYEPICGVPLLQRTAKMLARAGIRKVKFLLPEGNLSTERMRGTLSSPSDKTAVSIARSLDEIEQDHYLVLPCNLVWNGSFLERGRFPLPSIRDCVEKARPVIAGYEKESFWPFAFVNATHRPADMINIVEELRTYGTFRTEFIRLQGFHRKLEEGPAPVPITDLEDIKKANSLILRSVLKNSDGIISRNFNRKISGFISRILLRTSLHPNVITLFVFGLGLAAFFFTIRGDYLSMLLGTILINLNSIADGIDGEVARAKLEESSLGEWLDRISDKAAVLLFYTAILIAHFKVHHDMLFFYLGLAAVVSNTAGATILFIYGAVLRNKVRHIPRPDSRFMKKLVYSAINAANFGSINDSSDKSGQKPLKSPLLSSLNHMMKNDVMAVLYLVLALFGLLHVALLIVLPYGVMVFCLAFYAVLDLICHFSFD